MTTKASLGSSAIEQRAIEAHLERLQIEWDPITREIKSAGHVEGGMASLAKLAGPTGEITLSGLSQLTVQKKPSERVGNYIARLRGADAEGVAYAHLKGAQAALQAAGTALSSLQQKVREQGSLEPLANAARRLNFAAASVEGAISKESLAFATDADLTQIRQGWAALLDQFSTQFIPLLKYSLKLQGNAKDILDDFAKGGWSKLLQINGASQAEIVSGDVQKAFESIVWLAENFNLFDLKAPMQLGGLAKGTLEAQLLNLANVGHGLADTHPQAARFAREAYELISSFPFKRSGDDSDVQKKLALERSLSNAQFTLFRMLETEKYVKPEDHLKSLTWQIQDTLDHTVTIMLRTASLDSTQVTYELMAKRAEITGETGLASRIRQMSQAIEHSQKSGRSGSVTGINFMGTHLFASSILGFGDSVALQRSFAAKEVRDALEQSQRLEAKLQDGHLDSSILGAIAFVSLDTPEQAAMFRAEYDKFAKKPDAEFVTKGRELLAKIADQLESSVRNGNLVSHYQRIDGVHYSQVTDDDGTKLNVRIKVEKHGDRYLFPELSGRPTVDKNQLDHLRYRVTTDGWKSQDDVKATFPSTGWVEFQLPVDGSGKVEGVFHRAEDNLWLKHNDQNFQGYSLKL